MQRFRRQRRIQDTKPARFPAGEIQIPLPSRVVKRLLRLLHPVPPVRMARPGPGQARRRIQIQQERHLRPASARREIIDCRHQFRRQLAAMALVNRGGIQKPVRHHDPAMGEERLDLFPDQLGPACREQQQFGLPRHRSILRVVLQQMPDHFPDRRPAGLPDAEYVASRLLPIGHQQPDLRGLPASLPAFKTDKKSGHCCK